MLALRSSFVSSPIVSGGIIVFLCFILYDITGDGFKLNMSQFKTPSNYRELKYLLNHMMMK